MLSTYLVSDIFQVEGCLADLDVSVMVCMLTQLLTCSPIDGY